MSSSDVKATTRMLRAIDDPNVRRIFELMLLNIDILKDSVSALENPLAPEWIDATLQNGWTQYSDDFNLPQFYKDKFNIVHIRGLVKSGTTTTGTVLLSLPEGYRPDRKYLFDTVSNALYGRFDVNPNGDVTIDTASAAWLSIDNVSFSAER